MIISRTPLRITLGGGGTDDPEFVEAHGGFAVTAAINRYIYVGINRMFRPGYALKYSDSEYVQTIDEIKHPIIREALRLYDVPGGTEIISMADVPAGTGLGSSGAFGVGLCRGLVTFMGGKIHQEDAAAVASHIELDVLGRPGGRQDHWATAMGGVRELTFLRDKCVLDSIPMMSAQTQHRLQSSLQLFFTGYSRDADGILSNQNTLGLEEIKKSGHKVSEMLKLGQVDEIGELMNEHWELKKLRSSNMSNNRIDHCYNTALQNGAIGGKLVGAGGGGFLLFVARDGEQLSAAMAKEGLQETAFNFDHDGNSIIANVK